MLSQNKIDDIDCLDKCPFKELQILNLFNNQIKIINVFKNDPFKKIKELDLSFNSIENVDIFLVANFHKFHLNIEGNPLDYSNNNIEKIYGYFGIEYEYDSLFEFNYK